MQRRAKFQDSPYTKHEFDLKTIFNFIWNSNSFLLMLTHFIIIIIIVIVIDLF